MTNSRWFVSPPKRSFGTILSIPVGHSGIAGSYLKYLAYLDGAAILKRVVRVLCLDDKLGSLNTEIEHTVIAYERRI